MLTISATPAKSPPWPKCTPWAAGFIPSSNHAGGLRYHGMSPILSKLYHDGYMEAVAIEQTKVFEAATFFAKYETILPAPESAHAIRAAMDEALKCKETGEEKTILFGLTGTGYFDMTAYSAYQEGRMVDYIPTDADLQRGFDSLPKIPGHPGITRLFCKKLALGIQLGEKQGLPVHTFYRKGPPILAGLL